MSYELPANLAQEINELEGLINKFRRGELEATALKAHRVPFGCYEQRKDGTYMVRVRATGGAATPAQLIRLAELAEQYGSAFVHVTTRQEFQIHDVALENVVPVMRALLPVGLSSRGGGGNTVRNIVVSPTAGFGVDEAFDPSPYAFALTTRLIAESDSWNLPRKLKFAFSNSPADTAYAQFTDVGFVAATRDGQQGFKVYVAGGFGAKSSVGHLLHEFIPADQIYIVAEAVKLFFDQHGNRKNRNAARLRFLREQLGEERFLALYRAQFDAVAARPDAKLTPTKIDDVVPEVVLEPVHVEQEAFTAWKQRYARTQRQKGFYSILVPAKLGNIASSELKKLANFASAFGNHALRATFGQNLRLRNIPGTYLGNVYLAVKEIASLADAPLLLSNSVACTGADTCKLGICLPKGALTAVERVLRKSTADLDSLDEFRLNISGCPNSCGQHSVADLGFYGQARRKDQKMYPAYAIVAGARTTDGTARLAQTIDWISARDLPAFTSELLALWTKKKSAYASFADYIDQDGKQDIQQIAARYHDIPAFDEDKNYYYDWSASDIFTIVGRGVGECSAGLFDLIDVDLKAIEEQKKRLATELDAASKKDALYRIVLSASRMLLVTRGIEAPTEDAVFQSFLQHFIAAALVSEEHRPVVELAQAKHTAQLADQQEAVLALAASVQQLYESMDNSLRFPAEKLAKPAVPIAEIPLRDYRGVACPMNFVKVKLDLSRMKTGERVKVLLDDGKPIENVPRSVAGEGHLVVEQVQDGEHWSVVIEKR
jgi:sulfite reductase (ferredoxin)